MSQKLRGFVGQSMAGQKKALTPVAKTYTPGTYSFRVTKSGWYRFVLWGPGGRLAGGVAGGGGGFIQADRPLAAGQVVAIVVGKGSASFAGTDTVITLPSGEVLTAGAGKEGNDGVSPGGGGVATTSSGLDTKQPGTAAVVGVPGVGYSTADFLAGAAGSSLAGETPAAGTGSSSLPPGDGSVRLFQVKMGR